MSIVTSDKITLPPGFSFDEDGDVGEDGSVDVSVLLSGPGLLHVAEMATCEQESMCRVGDQR
jgi:hypothetical protein